MPTDVDTLMEMGFPQNRAQRALAKSGYKGVQVAMDWLFAHADDPDIDDPFEMPAGNVLGATPDPSSSGSGVSKEDETMQTDAAAGGNTAGSEQPAEQAHSFKCDECGKLLKDEDAVQFHAAKSGHSAFSESTEKIKPITAEEKKAQLEKIQETLKQRRLEREGKEKQEQLAKEKQRRLQGKEVVSIRSKLQEDEMKKIAEQKRREKMEEKLARQKVKEQIEKDKKDRALKFPKSSAEQQPTPSKPAAMIQPVKDIPQKSYDDCRLQIRLTNGKAITHTFAAKEPLAAVRLFVEMNRTDGSNDPFTFMTTFPRKVFSIEDMEKPLTELGLVPSAVLVLTKPQ